MSKANHKAHVHIQINFELMVPHAHFIVLVGKINGMLSSCYYYTIGKLLLHIYSIPWQYHMHFITN